MYRKLRFLLVFVLLVSIFGYQAVFAQVENVITISGDSDLVTFSTNWDPSSPFSFYWGVSGQPMQAASITIVNQTAQIVPPVGTISIFFNQPGVTVSTAFRALTNDGWYEIPSANHTITITGDVYQVQFTANYDPSPIVITWGVNNQPAANQTLTFTNKVATVSPPTNTVSLLFAPPKVTVQTSWTNLGAGWYAVPQSTSTPTPTLTSTPTPTSTPTITTTPTPLLDHVLYLPLIIH
jgi:hypothetical protein